MAAVALRREADASRFAPVIVGCASVLLLIGAWEVIGRSPDSALASVMPPPSVFLQTVAESGFRIGMGSQAVTVYQSVFSTLFRVFALIQHRLLWWNQ